MIAKHIHKRRFKNRADVRRLIDYLDCPPVHGDVESRPFHFTLSFPASEQAVWEKDLNAVHRMAWVLHEDREN